LRSDGDGLLVEGVSCAALRRGLIVLFHGNEG
jgi:hypothetical protein